MTAHQAPLSLGFSRQEHWSGFPLKSEREVTQSCLTLSNPMDSRLPGSSIHGIFQATVLDWVSIAFSRHCPWKSLFFFIYISVFQGFRNTRPHKGLLKTSVFSDRSGGWKSRCWQSHTPFKVSKIICLYLSQCQVAPGNPQIMTLNLNLCFLTRPFLVHLKHPSAFSHQDTGQQIQGPLSTLDGLIMVPSPLLCLHRLYSKNKVTEILAVGTWT